MGRYRGVTRKRDEPETVVFVEAGSWSEARAKVDSSMPSDYELAWLKEER